MAEAGQEADLSSLASVSGTGRGWRTKSPSMSCPAGSEGAGPAVGSERVRREEIPTPRISGAGRGLCSWGH
jgi:hypothetical protein